MSDPTNPIGPSGPIIDEKDYQHWKNAHGFKLLEDAVIRKAYQVAMDAGWDQAWFEAGKRIDELENT
jgi:hypothetical protein